MNETPALRIRKIVALLRTLDDPLPSARGIRFASQPGPAPDGRVRCSCSRIRQTHPAPSLVGDPDCAFCGGSGLRPARRDLDSFQVVAGKAVFEERDEKGRLYDLYTYAADVKGVVPSPPPERRSLAEPSGERDFGWLEARKAQERSGSYRELRMGMEVLYQRDYIAHTILTRAFVEQRYPLDEEGWPCLGPTWEAASWRGLRFHERRMPRPVKLPGWIAEQVRAEWLALQAAAARAKGQSERELARALGVDRRTVRKRVRAA